MKKYLDLKNANDLTKLKEIAEIIKKSGIGIVPTETVYGIGANGLDEKAVEKIYLAKGRKQDNPINLLVNNIEMVEKVAKNITELEYKLMKAFFPGPFTIILNKKDIVPNIVTANQNTVGVRMPKNDIALKLIEYAGVPIAAPSANISGKPSGTDFKDIYNDFKDKVDFMIDGGESNIGIESTIVKVIDNIPHVLRPGSITAEEIEKISGKVILDYEKINNNIPSSKYSHYKPNSKCVLVYNEDNEKMIKEIKELAKKYQNPLIVSTTENMSNYDVKNIINIGSRNNLEEIAKNIFSTLRKVDEFSADIVIFEGVETKGIGIAIMNRLKKACM